MVGQVTTKDLKAAAFPGLYQGGPDRPGLGACSNNSGKQQSLHTQVGRPSPPPSGCATPALPAAEGTLSFKRHLLRAALQMVTGPQAAWPGWKLDRNSHWSRQNTLEKLPAELRYG